MTVPSATPIRVLLADDHAIVRLGLRTLLDAAPDVTVVGEASDGAEAIALVDKLAPDVVIMDLSMDGMDGVTATKALARRTNGPKVLVLTMHDEEEYLVPLLEAGASGYIVKSAVSGELLKAVRTVADGRIFVRPDAAGILAERVTRRTREDEERERWEQLSQREKDVFRFIAEGYSPTQIGDRLNISAKTVDTYRRRINEKTGLAERADYVRMAVSLGLLGGDAGARR